MERTINDLINIVGNKNVLTSTWNKKPFTKGWRYGEGSALAVVKPDTLLQIWKILKICTRDNKIIIMQGANTGLTGGSTPDDTGYDRDIIIINTLKQNLYEFKSIFLYQFSPSNYYTRRNCNK